MAFGWTLEYTLTLPWPAFLALFTLAARAHCDAGVYRTFKPYSAAKYGGECAEEFFRERGSFLLPVGGVAPTPAHSPYTQETLERARETARSIVAKAARQTTHTDG